MEPGGPLEISTTISLICGKSSMNRSLLKPLFSQVEGSEEYIIETVDAVECRHWLMLIQSSRQNSVSRCFKYSFS